MVHAFHSLCSKLSKYSLAFLPSFCLVSIRPARVPTPSPTRQMPKCNDNLCQRTDHKSNHKLRAKLAISWLKKQRKSRKSIGFIEILNEISKGLLVRGQSDNESTRRERKRLKRNRKRETKDYWMDGRGKKEEEQRTKLGYSVRGNERHTNALSSAKD